MKMLYDLIIIGGGPAGYHAAEKAGHKGLKTLLFEKNTLGGVCLNEGCIPSKTLLNSAKIFDTIKNSSAFGVNIDASFVNYEQKKVIIRKNKVIKKLVMGIKSQLKNANVEIINSCAEIKSIENSLIEVCANDIEYKGKNILIATGSEPIIPPMKGLDAALESGFALTNKGILELENIPNRLVVIGAGVVGLEMAAYYSAVGSHVSVVEMLPKIAGNTDDEISLALQKNLEKKGIDFKLCCQVSVIGENTVEFLEDGEVKSLEADCLLVSTGRRAVTKGMGFQKIGIELDEKGFIKVDEHMRTNIQNIYAAGDVTGKLMLAHTAYRQAEVMLNAIQRIDDVIDYNAIPNVIYTSPEVACVGMSEETLKDKGIMYDKRSINMNYSGRYVAEIERGDGFCKLLFTSDKVLVGAHIIGQYASEIIMTAAVLIQNKVKIEDIEKYTFPHPSIVELIKMACL